MEGSNFQMKNKVNIAMLGCGAVADLYMPAFKYLDLGSWRNDNLRTLLIIGWVSLKVPCKKMHSLDSRRPGGSIWGELARRRGGNSPSLLLAAGILVPHPNRRAFFCC